MHHHKNYAETNISAEQGTQIAQIWIPRSHAVGWSGAVPSPKEKAAQTHSCLRDFSEPVLSRAHRLHRRGDILAVIRQGKKIATRYVHIYVLTRDDDTGLPSRIGCIVGKKVHASATVRHRVQRQLREIARGILPSLTRSYDMAWVAQPGIINAGSQQELQDHILHYLKRYIAP